MKQKYLNPKLIILFLFLCPLFAFAQTTGKISGKITDAKTKETLYGANIVLEGTSLGAAADEEGNYFIINIQPGTYSLKVSMMGYDAQVIKGVHVSVNRTNTINVELSSNSLQISEVVVSVDRGVSEKKDLTSSVKNVSSDAIAMLPVENISSVVGMQAGVVEGHFRGGRLTEVSYLVDGVSTTESFKREGNPVEIQTEAVQDLEVITGTFNAEYGRAMSGIVNMITKDGGNDFHGSATSYFSNYYTSHSDIFVGLKNSDVARNKDYKFQLEGPIIKNYVTFFTNFRYNNSQGYLNGIRRFNVNDYTDFDRTNLIGSGVASKWNTTINGNLFYSEHNGDGASVPMNTNENYSFMGKLSFKPWTSFKFSAMYSLNKSDYMKYGHNFKYDPDGLGTTHDKSDFFLVQFNHVLSNRMFYDLKLSYTNTSSKYYLYENPFDSRYVADEYLSGSAGFYTGGQDKSHTENFMKDYNAKFDLTWQATQNHSLKTGVIFTSHKLENRPIIARDKKYGSSLVGSFVYDPVTQKLSYATYEPEILTSSYQMDQYTKYPYELSAYAQDKMEFEDLVLNVGLRYDYFNANTIYPTQLRNPGNQDLYSAESGRMSTYPKAPAQEKISPRFGLSYTLGNAAVLHFSYGHFIQMPPLYALYANSRFLIPSSDYATILGNPNLKAEKTVKYEMGLWQELMPNMGLEVSVFYSDIYDLQSAVIVTTYNSVKYGLYSNKDYGNVKGLELKYDYNVGALSFLLNYTLQYTRGNAENPTAAYTNAGIDITKLVSMSWDQRHTFNVSVGYTAPQYNVTLTGYVSSGMAYTFSPTEESPLSKQRLYPNNQSMPAKYTIDFKGYYDLNLFKDIKIRASLSVYNLLDRLNEATVNTYTGRAYSSIITAASASTFRSNFNTIYDQYQDPSMYEAPREIKFGIGIVF
jgi:outer membrane receptor protein involved in Fe transport